MTEAPFFAALRQTQQDVESFIEGHLQGFASHALASQRLVEAMRYALLNGGKRLRPFLVMASSRLFGVDPQQAIRVACALEFVHCYSLVHDDLPAMDDDALRRGKPTTHRAFDEATAILVGDALLTEAFGLLGDPRTSASAEVRADLVLALAAAAGTLGMVGGQMLDLAAEGRFEPDALAGAEAKPLPIDVAGIRRLQNLKTGALLRFACEAGYRIAGGGDPRHRAALASYGDAFGFAFQLKDDLLDVEGDAALVGKAVGKDTQAGKATIVRLLGIAEAHRQLDAVTQDARQALTMFGERAGELEALVIYNRDRTA